MKKIRTTKSDSVDDFISICKRRPPHICAVNGPCNGWPKSDVPNPPNKEKWHSGGDDTFGVVGVGNPFFVAKK